ncbi:uncharacterized mitochondrial protein AtMg00810-like [Solanum lycopersicum]|uniref:uncharacterized mitochondrial protein AtMg00810-like n=1 Tax=Solanum lycopersicum TaxID=4081 RepID=UPI003749328C
MASKDQEPPRMSSIKSFLHSIFHEKDLGQLKYFLEIEVSRNKKGTFLSQRKYILDLHEETGKSIVKPCTTPMAPNMQLTKDDGDPFNDPESFGANIVLLERRP